MSAKTLVVLSGSHADETACAAKARLAELGFNAMIVGGRAAPDDSGKADGIRICATPPAAITEPHLVFEIDDMDTPEFAAEKLLDVLAGTGAIDLPTGAYSPEEEEQIRRRLADLGYIE